MTTKAAILSARRRGKLREGCHPERSEGSADKVKKNKW